MAPKDKSLLERPLYVFDLPDEILNTLTFKTKGTSQDESETGVQMAASPSSLEASGSPDTTPSTATSCNLCRLSFPTVQEQRDHVRSDLHGYNLKQKMRGLKPVDEADFEKLVGDLDESISGSESSDSESDEDQGTKAKDSTLTALLKRQAKISTPEEDDFISKKRKRGINKSPLLWFKSSSLDENTRLGVYRALFANEEQDEESYLVDTLKRKQLHPVSSAVKKSDPTSSAVSEPHYFLCMIGGGHFAAMVVGLTPKVNATHTSGSERRASVLAHKTFHRYTTRRKQGGSQAANDSAKGAAHSAGSSLRRYNEAALTNEVRELLSSWKPMIDTAELLFIRATGSTNRRTLFERYDGQVLRQNDPRIRGFPFSTRRATQSELMRAYVEVTSVKVSYIDEEALKKQAEAEAAKKDASSSRASSAPKVSKPTPEEEAAMMHTTQITSLVRRSKVPALMKYLSANSILSTFEFVPQSQYHHAPTPLHLAASLNNAPVVTALLVRAEADPTIPNEDDKTAFELAGDRPTRDAFRAARGELGESRWNWNAANVPGALSQAEVQSRNARERKEKEEEDAKEKQRREAEVARLKREEEEKPWTKKGKGRAIGSLEKTGAEKREEEARGMTPEMRARLERERRARAAEERIKRMQGGG